MYDLSGRSISFVGRWKREIVKDVFFFQVKVKLKEHVRLFLKKVTIMKTIVAKHFLLYYFRELIYWNILPKFMAFSNMQINAIYVPLLFNQKFLSSF